MQLEQSAFRIASACRTVFAGFTVSANPARVASSTPTPICHALDAISRQG